MVKRKSDIYDIPLELPYSEEKKRPWYEKVIRDAQERISVFALDHQWSEHVSTPLIKRVRVFETKEQFDREVKSAFHYDSETRLPQSFSAIVSDGTLLAVMPNTYSENYKVGQEEDAYEKLFTHELAHELHIRILQGEEDQMGPRWFFEGFALYAANQFDNSQLELTKEDIREIVSLDKPVTYAYYRLVMDELLLHMELKEAVEHAKYQSFKI